MKWYFVIYFIVNNVYIPGDLYQDGWSSLELNTYEECLQRKTFYDEYTRDTELGNITIAICQAYKPDRPMKHAEKTI